jgi:branched-chain amino acid transport system substrate-binding protein
MKAIRLIRSAVPIWGLVVLTLSAACANSASPTTSAQPITLGAALSATGFISAYDEPNKQSLLMAASEYNAKGGINGRQIKVIFSSDVASDPIKSAAAADDLIQKKVDIGITTCDYDIGGPASQRFQTAGILSFSVCASGLLYGPKSGLTLGFSSGDSTTGLSAAAAEFSYNTKGWKTAYILRDTLLSYDKELADLYAARFTSLGGKIVGTDTFTQGDASIRSQVARIKALSPAPDVIRLASVLPGEASAIEQIRQSLPDTPIIAGSESDGNYWHNSIPDMKHFFYTAKGSLFGDDSDPAINDFFKRYEKFAGKPATDSVSVGGYMIIQSLAIAAGKAGSIDAKKLATTLEGFKNVQLLTGPTTFSPQFHVSICRPASIMEATAPGTVKFVAKVKPTKAFLPDNAGGGSIDC